MKWVVVLLFVLTAAAYPQVKRVVEEFSAGGGVVKITPIRHASLMIEAGGQVMHVDPWSQGNYEGLPKADLILITDTHADHLDAAMIEKLRKPATVLVGTVEAAKSIHGMTVLRNGEKTSAGAWTIEAIPAYNLRRGPSEGRLFHEKGRGNGYVLAGFGMRIYISGDTENIPEMQALKNIDVAFVCMNLPYTMPPEEAAGAVKVFRPKVVYPYHYRNSDLSVFSKALAGSGIDVRIRDWYY